jgi:multidrug efflux pump subunit AcrA (membrane-fusion protein)
MRSWRMMAIFTAVSTILVGSLACNPFSSGNQLANMQQVKVARSDLVIKVNGSGKIKVDTDAKLTFGNNNGKIIRLNVKEGDKVKKGDVLAQLETYSLELAVTQANNAVAQALLGEAQSQSNLNAAQFALDKTKGYADLRDIMTKLEWQIQIAGENILQAQAIHDDGGAGYWRLVIANYRIQLAQKSQDLATLLSKAEYTGTVTYDIMWINMTA